MPVRFQAERDVPRGRRSTHEPDAPCPPFELPEAAADFELVVAEELRSNGGVVDFAPVFREPPIGFEPRYALLLRSPTVYETLGALNAFNRLGCLLTNRVRWSAWTG